MGEASPIVLLCGTPNWCAPLEFENQIHDDSYVGRIHGIRISVPKIFNNPCHRGIVAMSPYLSSDLTKMLPRREFAGNENPITIRSICTKAKSIKP
jgi:hypothetical protein